MDFFLLNYWQSKSHISAVASMILDYKFNHDSVELLCGANQVSNITYKELNKRWKDLFLQFYTQYEKPVEVITFPEIIEFDGSQIWEKAMNVLKMWFDKSNIKYGLIIRNYDLKGHLNFSKVKIGLNGKFEQCNERLLLFNPTHRVILTIYFNEDAKKLEQEVYDCVDEVNLLSLLLREELIGSNVLMTGIVVCSGKNSKTCCMDCSDFIVSFDIFTSVDNFNDFWCSYFGQENYKENNGTGQVFQKVASKILGLLAHFQYKTFDEAMLPTLKKHPEQKILEAELLLNRYQMEIVYSKEKRIFLTGSYGSGKSMVIYKKIELLQKILKDHDIIYYVNFEEKSHLDNDFVTKMKLNEKVKVIKGGFDLSYLIKSQILPKEKKNDTETIHLIVDEYDTQSLSSREASQLTEIFTNQVQFRNSTIFIAAQPIEISRVSYQTFEGREQTMSEEKHMLGELKNVMSVYNLRYVLRNTVEIYTLAGITQDLLRTKTNKYTHDIEPCIIKFFSPQTYNRRESDIKTLPLTANDLRFHPLRRIDHDVLYKLADAPIDKDNENCQRLVTSYRYNTNSKIGHNISGPLPQLIKVTDLVNSREQIALVAFFISRIFKINTKRVAIIHFESKVPPWLHELFNLSVFQGLKITFDPTKFRHGNLDQCRQNGGLVLVTEYRCVKGLEFSDVLLLLSKNEYYLKQFIPEAITRCMSHLSVLIVPCGKEFNQSETVSVLVNELEKANTMSKNNPIIEKVELKFCSKPICRTQIKDYCEDGCSKYVHKFTKFYQDFYEEIKQWVISDFQSHNIDEKEKAKSM